MLSIHTKLQDISIVSLGLPKVSTLQVFKAVYKIPKGVNIYLSTVGFYSIIVVPISYAG